MKLGKLLIRPGWLITIPVLMSFLAWAFPWPAGIRRGFFAQEALTFGAAYFLVAWYALLAMAATAGWVLGRESTPLRNLDAADDDQVYRIFTWLGAIGVLGMYAMVEAQHPGLISFAISSHDFNLVREAVPMTPGIATLRYATVIAGAIAAHRRLIERRKGKVHWLNMLLLVANVLAASRLALMMCVLLVIGLAVTRRRPEARPSRRRTGRWFLVGLLVLGVLTYANYARNANYYTARGTTNPITMMLGESVTYLGSPFQVSVATANAPKLPVHQPGEIRGSVIAMATPTFLGSPSPSRMQQENWYRGRVDVEPTLTTNSVVAALYGLLGGWSFPFMALVCAVAGLLMGHLSRYRSYMMLGSLVIGYCFAEVWRVYLFNEGIVWFLLLALCAACLLSAKKKPKDPIPVPILPRPVTARSR